jgi:integrase/recombinase XerD
MAHPRRALSLEEWPSGDRSAWAIAITAADVLDEPGLAAHWRPKTRHTVMTRCGFWLAWLRESGQLDVSATPAARVSKERLAAYVESLRGRKLCSVTIAGYIRDLEEAIRVMQPGADLSVINRVRRRLEAVAEPSRDKRLHVVSPAMLLQVAVEEMARLHQLQNRHFSRRTAERFRDALLIAFLATRPLRLANMTAIVLGRHLQKEGMVYWCRFSGNETKEGQPLEFPLPEALTIWFDHYLAFHRLLLLRGKEGERLWITIRSTPMVENTIYCRVTCLTRRLVGRPINPHLFRDCVATFIAEELPEEVRIVARVLGHATLATSEHHYNQAGMLSAQRRYLDALAQLRKRGHSPQV